MTSLLIPVLPFIALTVFILAVGHFYPHWANILGKTLPDPKRLKANYVYGILAIFLPFTFWVLTFGHRYSIFTIIAIMWIFVGAGGGAVYWMYWHDAKIARERELKNTLEIQELQLKQKDSSDGQTGRI